MDPTAFREYGRQMIDFVADYWDTLREKCRPGPTVRPGYSQQLIPSTAPHEPEDWSAIMNDVENVIMRGNTNWLHPHFYSYYPSACSYPSMIADILSGGIASVATDWASCPLLVELEMSMLDWTVAALGLPNHFRNDHPGPGCGLIENTASDAALMVIFAARARMVKFIKTSASDIASGLLSGKELASTIKALRDRMPVHPEQQQRSDILLPEWHDPSIFSRFVAYCSDQAHSSIEKNVLIAGVRLRKLTSTVDPLTGNYVVTGATLEKAIQEDRARGYIPFMFVASIGTTNSCAFDPIQDLAAICNREQLWIHVDAAYAGSYMICPENRHIINGIEMVDSFNTNSGKGMLVNFDCSLLWFKDGKEAKELLNSNTCDETEDCDAFGDFRNLQVSDERRHRALKLWFVFRAFGVEWIREFQRAQIARAETFSRLIQSSSTFELFVPRALGLVCFRLKKSDNDANQRLLRAIDDDGRIHLVPSSIHGQFFLRLVVCSEKTTDADIREAFDILEELAGRLTVTATEADAA